MAWYSNPGHTSADLTQFDIRGGGSIPAHLLQRRDVVGEIIAKAAPALKAYLDKKRADDIANEVLNMQTPPRAEAVDPSLQGAPATAPATGGADWLKAQQVYQGILDQQTGREAQSTNEYWKNKVLEAQANKYQADAEAPDTSHVPRYPITLDDGSEVQVTGNEAARYAHANTVAASKDSLEKIDKDVQAMTGHRLSEITTGSTNADALPDGSANITLADGKTVVRVPATLLENIRGRYAKLQSGGFNPAQAYRERQSTTTEPSQSQTDHSAEAESIRQAYKAGTMSRDDAKNRLKALGYD